MNEWTNKNKSVLIAGLLTRPLSRRVSGFSAAAVRLTHLNRVLTHSWESHWAPLTFTPSFRWWRHQPWWAGPEFLSEQDLTFFNHWSCDLFLESVQIRDVVIDRWRQMWILRTWMWSMIIWTCPCCSCSLRARRCTWIGARPRLWPGGYEERSASS